MSHVIMGHLSLKKVLYSGVLALPCIKCGMDYFEVLLPPHLAKRRNKFTELRQKGRGGRKRLLTVKHNIC